MAPYKDDPFGSSPPPVLCFAGEQEFRNHWQPFPDPQTVTSRWAHRFGAKLQSGSLQFAKSIVFVSSFLLLHKARRLPVTSIPLIACRNQVTPIIHRQTGPLRMSSRQDPATSVMPEARTGLFMLFPGALTNTL